VMKSTRYVSLKRETIGACLGQAHAIDARDDE
jgi:hypothetical protein